MAVLQEVAKLEGGEENIPKFLDVMEDRARTSGDEDLMNVVSGIKQQLGLSSEEESEAPEASEAFKCGGAVRKKVKKACGGMRTIKKSAEGSKIEQQRADSIANELKIKYPQYTKDQLAGRAPIMKDGKKYYMNGDGKLILANQLKKSNNKKAQELSKGGCPCKLKRVGGRIELVDSCTGLPVAKNGMMIRKGDGGFRFGSVVKTSK